MEMEISSANASVNSPDKRVSFCRPRGCLLSSPSHAHSGLVEQRGDWVRKGTALHCRPGVCHCNPDRPNQWLARPRQAIATATSTPPPRRRTRAKKLIKILGARHGHGTDTGHTTALAQICDGVTPNIVL